MEVARVLAETTSLPEPLAAERELVALVAEGVAERVRLGDDALWRPIVAAVTLRLAARRTASRAPAGHVLITPLRTNGGPQKARASCRLHNLGARRFRA